MFVWLVIWILSAIGGAIVAHDTDMSPWAGCVAGLLFGPFGVLGLVVAAVMHGTSKG